jgi:hypothetical protein
MEWHDSVVKCDGMTQTIMGADRVPSNLPLTPAPRAASGVGLGLTLQWIFRVAIFMEFVGHGAFGIITKPSWVPYFGVVAINEHWAYLLMPAIGAFDISMGTLALLSPRRAQLLYMAVWGLWTSLLRPLSGETVWEVLDRAGNFAIPFALLMISGWVRTGRGWFGRIEFRPPEPRRLRRLAVILRGTTVLCLVGHGTYGALLAKSTLAHQYQAVGLTSLPLVGSSFVRVLGWFELLLAVWVLIRPPSAALLFVVGFKIATELLYPITGSPIWEFVERGGSYAAPLALYFITQKQVQRTPIGTG